VRRASASGLRAPSRAPGCPPRRARPASAPSHSRGWPCRAPSTRAIPSGGAMWQYLSMADFARAVTEKWQRCRGRGPRRPARKRRSRKITRKKSESEFSLRKSRSLGTGEPHGDDVARPPAMTSSQIPSMSRMAHLLSRWGPGSILLPRQMARIATPQSRGRAGHRSARAGPTRSPARPPRRPPAAAPVSARRHRPRCGAAWPRRDARRRGASPRAGCGPPPRGRRPRSRS
jgi:hypothetical protein